jgi:hypothetical protein
VTVLVSEELLSPAQAARTLGLTPSRIRQLRLTGALPAFPTPIGFLFPKAAVERLHAAREARRSDAAKS